MQKLLLFIIFCMLLSLSIKAQVVTKYYLKSNAPVVHPEKTPDLTNIPLIDMPSFNPKAFMQEDSIQQNRIKPFRFGKGFDVNYSLKDGKWTSTRKGRIWNLRIHSQGAYSINLVLEELYLPKEAELYMYSVNRTAVYGPVTAQQNTSPNSDFMTDILPGNTVVLSLFVPKSRKNSPILKIKRVVHGYKNLFECSSGDCPGVGFGLSGECNVNVSCIDSWDEQASGVALIIDSDGCEHCSGALLNNTKEDFRPLFLTAFHCLDDNGDGLLSQSEIDNVKNWTVKFQYKMNRCENGDTITSYTYGVRDFRAGWPDTDFALVELEESPWTNDEIAFLGWDRSGNSPDQGTGIHHPSGDVMKITLDYHSLTETAKDETDGINFWLSQIDNTFADTGTYEGGSSGSPLFDQNKRVVGQLWGGNVGCRIFYPRKFWHGALYRSWTGGDSTNNQLSHWLDPTGISNSILDAIVSHYDINISISGPDVLCTSGATFSVNNVPYPVDTITWLVDPPGLVSKHNGYGTSFHTAWDGSGQGMVTITANLSDGYNEVEVSREVWVGSPQFSLSGMDELYTYDMGTVVVDYGTGSGLSHADQGSSTMDWSFTGPVISITGDYRKADYTSGHHTGQGWIYGESTNQCGSTTEDFYYEVIDGGFMMTLSPVPADDQLTVTIKNNSKETTTQTTQTEEYEYYLYNERYQLVKQNKGQGNRFQINTNDLPEGFYFLNVVSGEQVWRKKLEIKH